MVRIRGREVDKYPDGYMKVLGDYEISKLVQLVQSTCIANGNELERILAKIVDSSNARAEFIPVGKLNDFLDYCAEGSIGEGVYLATSKVIAKSRIKVKGHEPDFAIFSIREKKHCYIIEMKDGYEFDTKKAPGELQSLLEFQNAVSVEIPFPSSIYVCSFNQLDKEKIVEGCKHIFSIEQVMTGEEFCELLGMNYEGILSLRMSDTKDNLCYFIEELLKSSAVITTLTAERKRMLDERDFYEDEDM